VSMDALVHERFVEQATRAPSAVAVRCASRTSTAANCSGTSPRSIARNARSASPTRSTGSVKALMSAGWAGATTIYRVQMSLLPGRLSDPRGRFATATR